MTNGSKIAAIAAIVVVMGTVASCGGEPSPYCQEVEQDRATLDSFGAERSDTAFADYAAVLTSISKVAPAPIDEQWASLKRATEGVVTAHQDVGFALEDMGDEAARAALSADDITVLNKAYERFNSTTAQRKAVVADVLSACDIQLK